MGWAWYANDLSKYLSDAEVLADVTQDGDDVMGIPPDVPLQELDLGPDDHVVPEILDPYVLELPFFTELQAPLMKSTWVGVLPSSYQDLKMWIWLSQP